MKRPRLSALTGLVSLLTFGSSCSEDAPVPEASPVDAVSVAEHPQAPQRTPRQQLDQYKREQLDVLSDALLQEGKIESLFLALPATLPYRHRRTGVISHIGPLSYLFDLRSINTPSNTTNSFSAYLQATYDISTSAPSPVSEYTKHVIEKATELGLEQEYDITLLHSRPLLPFYEIIQDPTSRDLERWYAALGRVPAFIGKPFFNKPLASDFEQARALFVEEPKLYEPKMERSKDRRCFGCNYISGVPANASEPILIGRYPNGELRIPERAYGSVVDQDEMVFASQIEDRTTPFAKFLYRRGPAFTGNLEVIMGAYYTSFDKQDFLQKAQEGLLVARQVQE